MKYKNLVTTLLITTLLSSGCSLQKEAKPKIVNDVKITSNENDTQNRIISYINKVENSNLNIDMNRFYQNVKTLKIIHLDSNDFSYYKFDDNSISISKSKNGLEHELTHLILADRVNNKVGLVNNDGVGISLDEGVVELISSEIMNKKTTAYPFNVGIVKILSLIIGKDTIIKSCNENNNEYIIKSLSNIVPEYKDAYEYIEYLDYQNGLLFKMHEEYFDKGNMDNFKNTDEYTNLKNVRKDLINRIKIYIKAYYNNKIQNNNIDYSVDITNMLALLDIVDNNLFDKDIEINKQNDFFLREEISYIMNKYKLDDEFYNECVNNSKNIKFLNTDTNTKKKLSN